jgi:hypothetical protein
MASLTLGALLLMMILGKYIHTRRQFLSWNVQYGNSTRSQPQSQLAPGAGSRTSMANTTKRSHGIYDRWLMTRFAITFVMLSIFELVLILFQVSSATSVPPESPDLSAAKAKSDVVLFMPGCLPSLLLFIVFGTTGPFREHMRKTFLPKCFHKEPTGTDQPGGGPLSSQSRKSTPRSFLSDEPPPTPDEGSIIQLREVDQHREYTKQDDDEWPILTTTTRINGALV